MLFLMCVSCGEFVHAFENDEPVPAVDECPECEGTTFKHTETGRIIETGE